MTKRGTNEPQPRPKGVPTPCRLCPKIPAGEPPVPFAAADFTERHRDAYQFYLECKAAGRFPDDDLVRWYAAAFRRIEDEVARGDRDRIALDVLGGILGGGFS